MGILRCHPVDQSLYHTRALVTVTHLLEKNSPLLSARTAALWQNITTLPRHSFFTRMG